MKYYFIINPASGKLKKKKIDFRRIQEQKKKGEKIRKKRRSIGESIRDACLRREIPYEIFYTSRAGEARHIAMKIPDEECVVFSVGGDGNLNEVLNGVAGSEHKILGNIPMGSGNDFDKALSMLDSGIHHIDLGKINGKYFINVACIGLDADVANNLSFIRMKKWIPVRHRYNASLIYTYFHYQFKKLNISMGETTINNKCTMLAICNGQYYGGGFRIAPHAILNDGMFDVYIVEKMSKLRILPVLLKLIRSKHEDDKNVKKYKDAKIVVDCGETYTFNVDGEMVTANHFEVEIEKRAVRVLNDKKFIKEILED